jgi:hypothetical protein
LQHKTAHAIRDEVGYWEGKVMPLFSDQIWKLGRPGPLNSKISDHTIYENLGAYFRKYQGFSL